MQLLLSKIATVVACALLYNPGICRSVSQVVAWRRFRGMEGSGVSMGTFPTHFSPETNLLWKTAVPAGHSSPCIWEKQIFLTGYSDGKLCVFALNRFTGRQLWLRELESGAIERSARLSDPATATPTTDGNSLCVYFGSFGLICYDLNGNERWRKPLPIPVTQHGAGTSPVLSGGRIFLACDQDTRSFLLCVDVSSGEIIWKAERPEFKRGFATPLLYPASAPDQVILPGSLKVISYNFSDGSERWSASGLPNEIVASPVSGDGLIFAGGWTHGSGVKSMPAFQSLLSSDTNRDGNLTRVEVPAGPVKQHFVYLDSNKDGFLTKPEYESAATLFDRAENVLVAVRPNGTGDVSNTHVLWRQTRGLPYCPTPLYYDGRVYLVKNGGLATCIEARTGKVLYQEERLGALGDYYSSPVAADGKICVISQTGTAVVFKAGEVLQVLSRNPLAEPVIATPAIVDNKIFIRGNAHLFAFGERNSVTNVSAR